MVPTPPSPAVPNENDELPTDGGEGSPVISTSGRGNEGPNADEDAEVDDSCGSNKLGCKICDEAALIKGDAPAHPRPNGSSAGDEVALREGDEVPLVEHAEGSGRGGNAGRIGEFAATLGRAAKGALAELAAVGTGQSPPDLRIATCSARRAACTSCGEN